MKTFLRFVLLALILISVAMVSALTAMRFAIHGREVAVPKLVGLTNEAAEQQANADGLVLEVESRFYSAGVTEGKILSQSPPPGSLVRRGWQVRVAESLGPQKAEVPDLRGESTRAAEINIRHRGLEVGSVALADLPDEEQNQILAQSPSAASGLVESPKINVLIAAPNAEKQFVMPNFVGKHIGDVRQEIEGAGFVLHIHDPGLIGEVGPLTQQTTAPLDQQRTKDSGVIGKQMPAAGQRIVEGAVISFEITHAPVL